MYDIGVAAASPLCHGCLDDVTAKVETPLSIIQNFGRSQPTHLNSHPYHVWLSFSAMTLSFNLHPSL
jgi:hypothetical protein